VKRDLVVVLVVILALLVFNEGLKLVAGTEVPLAIVEGHSMWPTYDDGDILLIVGVNPSDLKVGDVIVYRKYDGTLVVHRIVDKSFINGKWAFRTQGDNNPYPDPYLVWENQVVGRVEARLIPKVGVAFKALMPYKYAIICLLIIVAVILALWPSEEERGTFKEGGEGPEVLVEERDKFKKDFK
jgi:signal peptidase